MDTHEHNIHSALPTVIESVAPTGVEGQVIRRQIVRIPLREVYQIEQVTEQ